MFSERSRCWLSDEEFRAHYKRYDPSNYRRLDRAWILREMARSVVGLTGDTAECGVYAGLTSSFMAGEVAPYGKTHHGFDSFAGLSDPGTRDGSYWKTGDLAVDEASVRERLSEHDNIKLYTGWIPGRFHEVAELEFCMVHVDVDLYEPTRDSLEFFYPRLVPQGVIVLDDYGFLTCPGARQAADEVLKGERIIELPTAQGLVIKGWPSS